VRALGLVGASPNFVKMAPVIGALCATEADAYLVHTGHRFDPEPSDVRPAAELPGSVR
jgi:UDP-N-acetylglucosamine 2-epimerase (non-hydrolysing)